MHKMLSDFLRERASRPFAWGRDDCSLVLADWWVANHTVDPAAWLRGTYNSRDTCAAVLAAHGGLQRLVTRVAREATASRTGSPSIGDFGLIAFEGRPYGAICAGAVAQTTCWAVRSETGVSFLTDPRVLRAWSINDVGKLG